MVYNIPDYIHRLKGKRGAIFMSQEQTKKTQEPNTNQITLESQNSWLNNNLYRLMIWVSAVWAIIVLFYITQFFGWSNLFLMMPDEFGGFLAGVTLPLAIIWIVVAYIDRGTSFKNEARFLRAYMNQLVYPEDGGAQTAKALADGIRSQVVEMQEATKLAMEHSANIKTELSARVEDFSKLVAVLDNYSSKTIVELANTVKELSQNFEQLNSKALQSTQTFQNYTKDFTASMSSMQKDADALVHNILPNINEIKYSVELLQKVSEQSNQDLIKTNEAVLAIAEKSNSNIAQAADILSAQADRIEGISQQAVKDCDNIRQTIDSSVKSIADVMQAQTQSMQNYIDMLNHNADNLGQKFNEQGVLVGQEVDKIISRANVAEESIALQVRELHGVSDDTKDRRNSR